MKLKFDPYQFDTIQVSGIPVYFKNIPQANGFVYVNVIVGVGARHDPVGKEGLAHFFEHMPFDGCLGAPSFADVRNVSKDIFFETLNAWTSFEMTRFTGKTGTARLADAMEFLSRFICKPTLDLGEIERERSVIIQEFWRAFSTPKRVRLERKMRNIIYGDTVFGRSKRPLGWDDTILSITKSDLEDFHGQFYHRGNVKIILVGDIDGARAKDAVSAFAEICPSGEPLGRPPLMRPCPKPSVSELAISASQYYGLSEDSVPKTARIDAACIFPIQENVQVPYLARGLLRNILFEEIRGKFGATYSPSVSAIYFADHFAGLIHLEVKPEMCREIRGLMAETISAIRRGDPKFRKAFEEEKRSSIIRSMLWDGSCADIIDDSADELADTGSIGSLEEVIEKKERVTYEDVAALFSREFNADRIFWHVITP